MRETVRMFFQHTTRKQWKVYHGYETESSERPLIRDIYLAPDGQLPENTKVIEVTITDEKIGGVQLFQTSGTIKSAIYRPVINPADPLARPSILVMYVERRPDLPLSFYVSVKVVT